MTQSSEELTATDCYRTLGRPVPETCAGWRADRYLAEHLPFLTRSGWQKRIREGEVRVNDRVLSRPSERLRKGDQLTYYFPLEAEPEVAKDVRLLWQEGAVMAVYKPAPLPMHANGPYQRNTFVTLLRENFGPEWAAVHRLDLETSGIVLCAATSDARVRLHSDLRNSRMRKRYLAIVRGVPKEDAWEVDAPIGLPVASRIRIKKWVAPDGLPAKTLFATVERGHDHALIEARPVTGRTNQIRIHSAYSGHVLVGDKLYHPDEEVFLEYFEHGTTENVIARTGNRRLCLHAASLAFVHPETGREVEVDAPFPDDLVACWRRYKLRMSEGGEPARPCHV